MLSFANIENLIIAGIFFSVDVCVSLLGYRF